MRMTLALLPCLALMPGGAAAQDGPAFVLPAGCEAFVTVQSEGCMVSHHFTCEGDPDGWQRLVDLTDAGPVYLSAIDAETQWMESVSLGLGIVERLEEEPRDRASFSELIAEGKDTFDFRTLSDQIGETRYVGFDELTGQSREIDGIMLEETEYRITSYDAAGEVAWQSKGRQWIWRDHRMFLAGVSESSGGGQGSAMDNTPVDFVFPGEPGFLASRPRHGCGATASLRPGAEGDAVLPAAWGAAP